MLSLDFYVMHPLEFFVSAFPFGFDLAVHPLILYIDVHPLDFCIAVPTSLDFGKAIFGIAVSLDFGIAVHLSLDLGILCIP